MTGKRLFLVLAAGALSLLYFANCVSAAAPNQQDMRCCAPEMCAQATQSQKCCEATPSPQAPNMLPTDGVTLHSSIAATFAQPELSKIIHSAPVPPVTVEVQLHSPPELYVLNASLLI